MHLLPLLDLPGLQLFGTPSVSMGGIKSNYTVPCIPCKIFSQQVPPFLCDLDDACPKAFGGTGRARLCILEKPLVISSGEMHGAMV